MQHTYETNSFESLARRRPLSSQRQSWKDAIETNLKQQCISV